MNILVILILCGLLALVFFHFSERKKKHTRQSTHVYNIDRARRVLNKMREIEVDHRSAAVLSYMKKVDPYVFEEIVLTAMGRLGFGIVRNNRYSGDGGLDGRCHFGKHQFAIQCKRYKRYIDPADVSAFSKSIPGNCRGLFFHTGRTGPTSREVTGANVSIISGELLVKVLLGDISLEALLKQITDVSSSSDRYLSSKVVQQAAA